MSTYDNENIFAKILRGEIPHNSAGENAHALAFHDIAPQAKIHILVIPKGSYINYDDYLARASNEEKAGFDALMLEIIEKLEIGVAQKDRGYRVISNAGAWGVQEIPHYHMHVLSGEIIGPMRPRKS